MCFKVVPDLDMMSAEDWVVKGHSQVDTGCVPTMLNPYDESALELALKLKDANTGNPVDLQLTALTIGTNRSHKVLKNLLALKYDHAVRVDCGLDLRFNAPAVAAMIHQYMKSQRNHQVILFGSQSNEGDNGKTPLLVAESLGVPCINAVTNVTLSEQKGCLDVTFRLDDWLIEQTVKLPVVLAVGNAPNTYIRVPTLKDKMQSSQKEVEVYFLKDLGLAEQALEEANDIEIIELFYEQHERSGVFIQGRNAAEKADVLYEDYIKKRVKT
ncbi:hypothetical protein [Sporomusa sp.]|uniref:electron transfer flavoprotein subunit beta/FixA family protein n=1 Tax=Sporomusa sp. TaxID=2078658 RepID=UPI002BCCDCD6|nr:hypothetical protein [Sporomusa sp.]HWR45871.1 hypothetical protein [Sporomusa sp.]